MFNVSFIYDIEGHEFETFDIELVNVELLSKEQFLNEIFTELDSRKHKFTNITNINLDTIYMYNLVMNSYDSDEDMLRLNFYTGNDASKKLILMDFLGKYYTAIMQEFRYYLEICKKMTNDGLFIPNKENMC